MRRREFLGVFGGTVAGWPLVGRAQQPALPIIGFLHSSTKSDLHIAAFHEGLNASGYAEGRNVTFEFRWAENQPGRLPALADELVSRQVSVIVANFGAMAAAMAATKNIPIVFSSGDDPVTTGLVTNLSRPGGNVTGVSFYDVPLGGKRLGLLHELVPKSKRIALLLDPNFAGAVTEPREMEAAAQALGRQLITVKAGNESEIDRAFSTFVQSDVGALVVGAGPYFVRQRHQIVERAAVLAVPAIYIQREYVVSGGLMSYGASLLDAYRRAAGFVARILNGEKPADMPVELPTKFELVINLKTAKALGLTVPSGVLAIADEVIE